MVLVTDKNLAERMVTEGFNRLGVFDINMEGIEVSYEKTKKEGEIQVCISMAGKDPYQCKCGASHKTGYKCNLPRK